MKNKVTKIMNFALLFVLMGVTFYVIFSKNDINTIIDLVVNRRGNAKELILGLLFAFGSIACEAVIICILLYVLKEKTKYYICLKYSFIGFYYCAITPSATGGQPVQVYYMTKDGHKISTSSLIVLVIIITYKVALLALLACLAIFNRQEMLGAIRMPAVKVCFIFGLLVNVVCVALYLMVLVSSDLLKRVLSSIIRFFAKIKIIRKPEKMMDKLVKLIDEYAEGVEFIKNNLKVLCPIMIITLIQRIMLFSIPYLVYRFLGVGNVSYFNFLTLQVVLSTAVDSLPVPGGIGAAEIAFNRIYSLIYTEAVLGTAMILTRGVNFYAMLVVSAIVSLVVYVRTNCCKKKHVVKLEERKQSNVG